MLLSTAYLPCIEYIACIVQATSVSIEAHEHYIKQSYRNRTYIASAQGAMELIIPVIQPNGSKTNIRDVKISYAESWQKKHWHAIISAYNSSPFFEYYQDLFNRFYSKQYSFIWDYNSEILTQILKACQIETEIKTTQQFTPPHSDINDKRYQLSPKTISNTIIPKYTQVFGDKHGFIPHISILDTLCNLGPETGRYCSKVVISQ